jgi:hypothetical protein
MANMTLAQVLRLADKLSPRDQLRLVEHLTRKLSRTNVPGDAPVHEERRAPQDLYGVWRGRFPDDIDVDGLLQEIRHEWEAEWPEVFER